jgi:hypothetical protein
MEMASESGRMVAPDLVEVNPRLERRAYARRAPLSNKMRRSVGSWLTAPGVQQSVARANAFVDAAFLFGLGGEKNRRQRQKPWGPATDDTRFAIGSHDRSFTTACGGSSRGMPRMSAPSPAAGGSPARARPSAECPNPKAKHRSAPCDRLS